MNIKYEPETKPGISNLITIYSILTDLKIEEIEEKYKESNYYVGEVTDVKIDIPVTGPNVYVNSAGEFGASINVTFTTLLGYGYMGSTYISY